MTERSIAHFILYFRSSVYPFSFRGGGGGGGVCYIQSVISFDQINGDFDVLSHKYKFVLAQMVQLQLRRPINSNAYLHTCSNAL